MGRGSLWTATEGPGDPTAAFDAATPPSALSLPGVLEFNATRWGLRHEILDVATSGGSSASAIVYMDRRGRLVQPPLTPYTAIEFRVPEGCGARRRASLWVELAGALAERMRAHGIHGLLPLSPDVADARPWQWRGFEAQLRYTFIMPFPYSEDDRSRDVRRRIRQAQDLGTTCRLETEPEPETILACLRSTERRQGFHDGLSVSDLTTARQLIGEQHLRMYTCSLPDGEVVSARIVLHRPGSPALGWLAGTRERGLSTGASQLLMHHVLMDLESQKASGIDFCGANLESVASEKKGWGATLVDYPTLTTFGFRSVAIAAKRWWSADRHARRSPPAAKPGPTGPVEGVRPRP